MELDELKTKVLKLLEEDMEFRYAVAGLIGLGEILKRLDKHDEELQRIWREIERLREDMVKGFERYGMELTKLREEQKRVWEEIARLREDMAKGFESVNRYISALNRYISALGARWGIESEEAFREGLRGILEKELGFKVERWRTYDERGIVFGYPSEVEIDIAIVDGKIVLVEVSSHIRASDIYIFKRKAELYEEKTGRKPDRLIIVTPYADRKAFEAAAKLGVEIYTKV